MIVDTVKKQVERVETLADEIKLHIHLASLDAKQEWDEKLAPRVEDVKNLGHKAGDAVGDLVERLEGFAQKVRGATTRTV